MLRKVLVVDDDGVSRKLLTFMLRSQGWEVVSTDNGESALEKLSTIKFKLAILDLNLPGERDGIQTAEELHRIDPNIKIVFMSGDSGNETKIHTTGLGPFFTKPFEI